MCSFVCVLCVCVSVSKYGGGYRPEVDIWCDPQSLLPQFLRQSQFGWMAWPISSEDPPVFVPSLLMHKPQPHHHCPGICCCLCGRKSINFLLLHFNPRGKNWQVLTSCMEFYQLKSEESWQFAECLTDDKEFQIFNSTVTQTQSHSTDRKNGLLSC